MSKIQDDLKAFNDEQKALLESLAEKQKKASDAFVKKIVLDLRPKFAELGEVMSGLTPDLRSAVLADGEIHAVVKVLSPKRLSSGGGKGDRVSAKMIIMACKDEAKTDKEIEKATSAKKPLADRLNKLVEKKKLKLVGNKYQAV